VARLNDRVATKAAALSSVIELSSGVDRERALDLEFFRGMRQEPFSKDRKLESIFRTLRTLSEWAAF